jgi:hypothetical protein
VRLETVDESTAPGVLELAVEPGSASMAGLMKFPLLENTAPVYCTESAG